MRPLDDPDAGPGGPLGLRETTAVWEAHAQADPLWAVLSDPVRAGRRWDLDTFLESGRTQVDQALGRLDALGGTLVDHALALDFGCGVGRLSQALGDRFERVLGLDVSPTMVAVARRLNRHGDRVTFRCNDSDRLEGVASGSVSLALSLITLQHVPPALARGYLAELLRVVQPGGAAIVQVPSHLDEAFLPSDRDDRPVDVEDRRAELVLEPPAGPLQGRGPGRRPGPGHQPRPPTVGPVRAPPPERRQPLVRRRGHRAADRPREGPIAREDGRRIIGGGRPARHSSGAGHLSPLGRRGPRGHLLVRRERPPPLVATPGTRFGPGDRDGRAGPPIRARLG